VAKVHGPRDRRFRDEHSQHLRPADIPRFGQIGVVASMQPYHAIDDGRWVEGRIGPVRIKSTYAFRTLLDTHAHLAFGSDWIVARRHSTHPIPSASTGVRAPGAGLVLVPLSFCGACAEVRPSLPASSRCPCCSKLTAKWWASRIIPIVRDVFSTATTTMGGSK